MKVTILTFSLTRNTLCVEKAIAKALEYAGHSVKSIDLVNVVRAMHLMCKDRSKMQISDPTGKEKEYLEMIEAVSSAEVLGLGSLAFCYQPAPGCIDVLEKQWLPDSSLSNIKFTFSFASRGNPSDPTTDVIATFLTERIPSAVYAGKVDLQTPDNYSTFQPLKPYVDCWVKSEIEKMNKDIEHLVEFLKQATDSSSSIKSASFVKTPLNKTKYLNGTKSSPPPIVDNTKCIKCGTCVRVCPYNAISISSKENDGCAVINKELCYGCCLCFHQCPKEAITYESLKDNNVHRMRISNLELEEEEKKNGNKNGFIFRENLDTKVYRERARGNYEK